ncbi:MAG: histidine phosphatase family protein [Chitinophagaceae bacterium]|nr:histidine phosphatase family protein [Chitinophagaceae bacterium]
MNSPHLANNSAGKMLILVRHAKSDWGNAGLNDFDRPLNERGKRDAPKMTQRLVDKSISVDAIVCSPAKRAATTATFFAEAFNTKPEYVQELYLAAPETFYKIIASLKDSWNSVMVVSHNNGLTDFANMLTNARIDNIPTCGVFAVKADCNSWEQFREAKKEFLFFDYPKNS